MRKGLFVYVLLHGEDRESTGVEGDWNGKEGGSGEEQGVKRSVFLTRPCDMYPLSNMNMHDHCKCMAVG